MKKFLVLAFAVAMTVAPLTACSQKETEAVVETPEDLAEEGENGEELNGETSAEITISHSYGETVVPVNPEKVVVFDMGILDTMEALDVDVEIAVPASNVPTYLEEYATDAVNAGGIKEPDLEAIYEFAPEVIFISGRQADYYEELTQIAPTVYVDLNTETYMDDFAVNVINVGQIFKVEEGATAKLSEIQALVETGNETAAGIKEKALIILTNDGSISAYGKGSRFGIIHDVLGIKTADGEISVSTHGQEANYEYIAQINPDILYVVDRTAVVGGTNYASDTLENELIQQTSAYQNDKIIYLDAETWYLAGGGITSVKYMINESLEALN